MPDETAEPLWCVHIFGPDDMIAEPSKESAQARADEINFWATRKWWEDPGDAEKPLLRAEVELWPYGVDSHTAELAKGDARYG